MKCSALHSKDTSEGNVGHLLCPLFILCEKDGYEGRKTTFKSERLRAPKHPGGI